MGQNDSDFVERCRDGHPEDFRLLVERYQRPLFSFLRSRMSDAGDAEEAAQEAFVRAFLSLGKLRKPESFYGWLLGIAIRVVKEQFRKTSHLRKLQEAFETFRTPQTADSEHPLEEAIAELPAPCREVILLRFYEGLSCQEIATRLHVALGTVTKTLSRAYALLRAELQVRERGFNNRNQQTVYDLR